MGISVVQMRFTLHTIPLVKLLYTERKILPGAG